MKVRLFLIKILIISLWNSHYPVNCLRMGYNESVNLISEELYDLDKEKRKIKGLYLENEFTKANTKGAKR